jgi:sugar phosphate isomerase/epimerase
MMKFGMHNWMRPEPLEVTVERLARYGYDAIELMGEPAAYDINETLAILKKHKINCTSTVTIMSKDRDLTHNDPRCWQATVHYIESVIKMAADLGGECICCVPTEVGYLQPRGSIEECWKRMVEGLKQIAEAGRRHKNRIGLEPLNRFESRWLNRCEQALALADAVGEPGMGVTLDTFHMNIEEADPVAAIKLAGRRLVDFHLGDSNRRPPGLGHIDFRAIVKALGDIGYNGGVHSEFVMPIDRTPLARKPTVWGGPPPEIPGVPPEQLKFIFDLGSGVLTQEEYDAAVKQTITHIKSVM